MEAFGATDRQHSYEMRPPQFVSAWMHCAPNVTFAGTLVPAHLPAGQHSHSSYEFFIPFDEMVTQLGDPPVPFEARRQMVLPINSWQPHGPERDLEAARFMGLMIEAGFVNETAATLGAKSPIEFVNVCAPIPDRLRFLLSVFAEESRARQSGHELVVESLSTQIIVTLLRILDSNLSPDRGDPQARYDRRGIARAIEFLRENFAGHYSLAEVARVAGLSPYHFIRVFRAQTGKPPHEFLLDIKMEKARELLQTGQHNITEISYRCGFSSPSHFATVFKRVTGLSPSDFRRLTNG